VEGMMEICEIYVYLMDEGVDVWRPVKAQQIEGDVYKIIGIEGYDPEDEKWQFIPGDIVKCEEKTLADGKQALVAVEKVSSGT